MAGSKYPRQLAIEYRKKFGKEVPTLQLARKLRKDHPVVFNSVDHARTALRTIEGKTGTRNRRSAAPELLIVEERPRNPYNLPPSDARPPKPYVLPKEDTNILVLSDIHIPYHSIEALTIALDYGKEVGVNTIILNGDLIDCHHLSRFQKDPRKRHFSEERKMTREFLQTLRDAFPNAHIIYKCGNHDARLDKYVQQHAPELYGEKCAQLKHLLKLKNLNIAWVNDKRIIKVSGLNLAHGHELGGSSFIPVNPARSLFTKATANAMVGHHHRTSENTIKTLEGNMITTWSSGCLCELHPDFMPYNQHNHGFAHIRRDGDHFEVINKRINGNELF